MQKISRQQKSPNTVNSFLCLDVNNKLFRIFFLLNRLCLRFTKTNDDRSGNNYVGGDTDTVLIIINEISLPENKHRHDCSVRSTYQLRVLCCDNSEIGTHFIHTLLRTIIC